MKAVKKDEGKPRLDLLPFDALLLVGQAMTFGLEKYSDRNWESGLDWGRLLAAELRHLFAWASGEDTDPESKLPHLAHAGACVLMLLASTTRNIGKDSRKL